MIDAMYRLLPVAALGASLCCPHPVSAQTLPERFLGVWKLVEGSSAACKQADWTSDARTDVHIRIGTRQTEYHEATCRHTSLQTTKPDHDSSAVRLTRACVGEGEKWQSTQIWQTRTIDGVTMLLSATTDRGREGIFVYRQCDPAPTAVAAKAGAATGLPLKRGYYVASDTPCGSASNATLQLVRRNGIGVARMVCQFKQVEQTGAATWRVTEECREITRDDAAETSVRTYEIASDNRFKVTGPDGASWSARYCAQSSLPAPWRSNDIRDLMLSAIHLLPDPSQHTGRIGNGEVPQAPGLVTERFDHHAIRVADISRFGHKLPLKTKAQSWLDPDRLWSRETAQCDRSLIALTVVAGSAASPGSSRLSQS